MSGACGKTQSDEDEDEDEDEPRSDEVARSSTGAMSRESRCASASCSCSCSCCAERRVLDDDCCLIADSFVWPFWLWQVDPMMTPEPEPEPGAEHVPKKRNARRSRALDARPADRSLTHTHQRACAESAGRSSTLAPGARTPCDEYQRLTSGSLALFNSAHT